MDKTMVTIPSSRINTIIAMALELASSPPEAIVTLLRACELIDKEFRADDHKDTPFMEMMTELYNSFEEVPHAPSIDVPQGSA